jgi:RNA polymerase sigma-70 factor (ECF subfamily)
MIIIILPDISVEDRLLAQARAGSQEAVMEIYEHYFPPIYQFLRLRVEDRAAAEDLASDVFVRFVESLGGRSAPRTSLRGWLFRVARNKVNDYYGRQRQFPSATLDEWIPASSDTDPETEFIRRMSLERSRTALRRLPADQQEVLILRFGQALNLQETADIMDRSVSAIKSLQFRAVNTLRQALGELRLEADYD